MKLLLLFALVGTLSFSVSPSASAQAGFSHSTVATDLVIPWEIEFGPDGTLWTTERIGIMSRIDIETGKKKVILDRRDIVYTRQETGMLGFTWHPDFADTPYVYIAYVGGTEEHFWRVVERYTYKNDTLTDPVELFRLDPANIYHQGCRLNILPDRKLYVTMGDAPHSSQADQDSSVIGKILRMNLDGSVPDDNPVPGQLMYSKGHRNVQGFVRLPNGNIWSAEHGDAIEDEVNLVEPLGNYGWPYVEGVCDEEWETAYCDTANVKEPKWSSGPERTVAPCALDYYNHDRYPSLKNSLLLCTLKYSTLYKLGLNEAGDDIVTVQEFLTRSIGRIRDVAIHPDGRIFVCTSNQEVNGFYPFAYSDDDRIVELIPFEQCSGAQYSGPDTVRTRCLVDDRNTFAGTITNSGDCPMRINGVWTGTETSPLQSGQWRVPVIIPPGTSYDLALSFSPTEAGNFEGLVKVVTATQGQHDIVLLGSTSAGRVKPVFDTVVFSGSEHALTTKDVLFTNDGNDTVRVSSASIVGTDKSLFSVQSFDPATLSPGEEFAVTVHYSPLAAGQSEATLILESTAYRQYRTTLQGFATVTISPQEPGALFVFPNPFSGELSIVVPHGLERGTVFVADMLGASVWQSDFEGAGVVFWGGKTSTGQTVASAVYMVYILGNSETYSALVMYQSN